MRSALATNRMARAFHWRAARTAALACVAALSVLLVQAPVAAQGMERVDPNAAIDADLARQGASAEPTQASPSQRYPDAILDLPPETYPEPAAPAAQTLPTEVTPAAASAPSRPASTYAEDDLIGAAEGLFGRGAEGLARLIQTILADQGEPNAYIVGREGGGAFIFGVRYGSGTLYHRIEGNMPVYWTGPSIGIDAGANAGNTFVLVYNLDNTDDLFERFPAGEGQAYLVGGFTASYLRKGNIVLIPIRVGAGLRLGVNAGYMRFSRKQRWVPF